jgi:hypothetical protein
MGYLNETQVFILVRKHLLENDWQVIGGQPPSGTDHLPVIEIRDPMHKGNGSKGSYKPDLIAWYESKLVIIELKQWTDVDYSELPEHVNTFVGQKKRDVVHPSYQARSYASLLEMYNEYVYETPVKVTSCAYLHNCVELEVVNDSRYEEALRNTPVFVKGQKNEIVKLISDRIKTGGGVELLKKIDSSPTRPSLQLAEAVSKMLQGKEAFVLIDDQKTVLETIIKASQDGLLGNKQVVIVKGGPGTGKSVVAINALSKLMGKLLIARYVTPYAAPRAVLEEKLKSA